MQNEFVVASRPFSSKHPLIIAEIGTAHMGELKKAFELIDAASFAGCDAVKFQIVYADEILHPKSGWVKLPSGNVLLYDRFKQLELPFEFYQSVAEYAQKKGLMFSASAFGDRSLEEVAKLEPAFFKIASPELNYHSLIKNASKYGAPLILSTGVSRLSDIEDAVEVAKDENSKTSLSILHCITSYPAPESEYNLSLIENLSRIFCLPVGLSDHSMHPFFLPLLSLTFGGCIIEKHICLSKAENGLDDKIALEPKELALMCEVLRKMEGSSRSDIIEYLQKMGITKESISTSSGNGSKVLALSEKNNYRRTNRSLHYLHDMKKGEKIKKEDVAILRTEKTLSVGLSPKFYDMIVGAKLQKDISAGDGVSFEDIIER